MHTTCKLQPGAQLARNDSTYSCQIEGEVVLFHPVRQEYFQLDTVGAAVWRLLEAPRTLDEIVSSLVNVYEVSFETCREEITVFLEELVGLEFLNMICLSARPESLRTGSSTSFLTGS